MKGFIGGIPVALLAVAAQAKFAERHENDFHPQAGGTAIGGPSGNDGHFHPHPHPQTGGTAIGGPSGNDVDGGFVSPYSANIKTDTKVNEWEKDDHSIKLKHTDVYPRPPVVPVPFGHGPQVPGMGPFANGKRSFPGGTAMGGPSGNDEGQSFDMSVTGVFNTEVEDENQDDHSTDIKNTDVYPGGYPYAKRFGPPHAGGTAIGGPSGNDGGQSFSAPTNIHTTTGINEHNEDSHSIDLEHEDIYPRPHSAFAPFRRSENFGPPGHGGPHGHFEPHYEPHYEPHPEPHFENHPEPHVEHHPEPHYAPHYSPSYEPHYEPHTTLEHELTAAHGNNNGPSAGAITFGRRGFPVGPASHFEPHPEPHFENHPEPHVEHHPEPHYSPSYSPSYEPHYEPHTTLEHELTSVQGNNNGPAAGGISFGRRGFPGLESHFEPHPEPHYAPHPEPHFEHHPEPHYSPSYSPHYEPHHEPHTTFDYDLTSVKNNNNGPGAGGIAFGRRAFAPPPVSGGTAIGGPSGDDEGTGFSAPTNIDVATGVDEHNEDNHAIDGDFAHVHPPADYREETPQCAAQVHEVVHTVTKTQYQTAMETNAIPLHVPQKSVAADPSANYPENPVGADPYANYPENPVGADPYASDPENPVGADPYANYPGVDANVISPSSPVFGSEDVPYALHGPAATPAAASSAVYNYPQHSAGADPYAPHKYASQGPSYSKIAVHVPMATPASYAFFSKATPSSSMGKMIPTGAAAEKAASSSASPSASVSHGMMFQGDAARLSGGIVSAAAAVMGVLAFIL
ncbi:unnamed protein product [Penicillium egyptiacum]|uniref:GPI anchored protein n=1 Tax=Penicillium egyptiacum TaxID=1303716 RepID=A0A9W4K5A6_9EURO|nr:unnamed protein product [Penicillium egyptiacum]